MTHRPDSLCPSCDLGMPTRCTCDPTDATRRESPSVAFCYGGSGTCTDCVGSCGIEEYEERSRVSP
jgi:hypothetical protein